MRTSRLETRRQPARRRPPHAADEVGIRAQQRLELHPLAAVEEELLAVLAEAQHLHHLGEHSHLGEFGERGGLGLAALGAEDGDDAGAGGQRLDHAQAAVGRHLQADHARGEEDRRAQDEDRQRFRKVRQLRRCGLGGGGLRVHGT